ncbi:MAG: hypothetical protein ACE5HT_03970, partial [Gemmatimonadales bacterium]
EHRAVLKELTRTYRSLVEDTTRVMLRLKALFRARGIPTCGTAVYHAHHREGWLARLTERGARFRAEALYAELDVLRALRPRAKAAKRCSDGGHRPPRSAAGLLPQHDRAGHAPRAGAGHAHSQARRNHAAPVEERRTLRSDEADHTSALAPVPRGGGEGRSLACCFSVPECRVRRVVSEY